MRRSACFAATALALLAFCPAVQASKSADPPGNGETIALKFDWPKRLRGRVRYMMRLTEKWADRQEQTLVDMHYKMSVRPVPEGIFIRGYDFKTEVTTPGSPGGGDPVRKLFARLTSQSPPYLVSNDGRFLRIHDLPTFRKNFVAALEEHWVSRPPRPPISLTPSQQKKMISAIYNDSTVHATASAEWDTYVGVWRDLRLKVGDVRRISVHTPVAILKNAKVPMYGTVLLKGRTACHKGARKLGCVELLVRMATGGKEIAAALEAYMDRVIGQREGTPMRRIRQTRTLRIICDPATLLPFATDSRTETTIYGDGKDPIVSSLEEEWSRYSY